MKISESGIQFIKEREGYRSVAYKLSNDVYTLGYGLTYIPRLKRKVRATDTTTEKQADSDFRDFIETQIRSGLNKALGSTAISQSGYDALTSYCFNRSVGLFKVTGLYQMILKNPKNPKIKEQFKIDWGTNQTYKDSLITRRGLEGTLYFKDSEPNKSDSNASFNTTNIITGIVLLLIVLLIFNHKKVLQTWNYFKEKYL